MEENNATAQYVVSKRSPLYQNRLEAVAIGFDRAVPVVTNKSLLGIQILVDVVFVHDETWSCQHSSYPSSRGSDKPVFVMKTLLTEQAGSK